MSKHYQLIFRFTINILVCIRSFFLEEIIQIYLKKEKLVNLCFNFFKSILDINRIIKYNVNVLKIVFFFQIFLTEFLKTWHQVQPKSLCNRQCDLVFTSFQVSYCQIAPLVPYACNTFYYLINLKC